MFYLLTILLIIGYGFLLFYWSWAVEWRLDFKTTQRIKAIHYAGLTICLVVGMSFALFDIGLRGLWTTRVVIMVTLITGMFLKFVADRAALKKIESVYFRFFSFLPIATAGMLLVPFVGVLLVASLWGRLTGPAEAIYYEDGKLRIQSTFSGVLGPPRIDIYQKEFIFEKHLCRADYWASEIDSISVSYDTDSTRVIAYGLYDYDTKLANKTETISLELID